MNFGKSIILLLLGLMMQSKIMGQEITVSDLAGVWQFNSWKTLHANFHPDMEPEEGSTMWQEVEVGAENPTSVIMEVVFNGRKNLDQSTIELIDQIKSGPWRAAMFNINGKTKEGWWEYIEEENVLAFIIEGYEYNLYFHIRDFKSNQISVIEKLYKTESDAFFHYTTLTKIE